MLRASLLRRQGDFTLEVGLEAAAGTTLVLVGESGSGKTTLLRLLAGLAHPDRGSIELEGVVYFDSATGIALPAREREIGYVAQDYALFPHLSVLENVAFGLRARGVRGARATAREVLERLDIAELARRRPTELSGGQQQRVALARALAIEPRVLLLDEPLAALDLRTRRSVRAELKRLLATLPCLTLYVTHSPAEAMAFGGRLVVLENGRATQDGTREEVLRRPRSDYVAEFLGLNLFHGTWVADATGGHRVAVEDARFAVAGESPTPGDGAFVVVDPADVTLSFERPQGSRTTTLEGPIVEIVAEPPRGERVRVWLATRPALVAELTSAAAGALALRAGQRVCATIEADSAIAFR